MISASITQLINLEPSLLAFQQFTFKRDNLAQKGTSKNPCFVISAQTGIQQKQQDRFPFSQEWRIVRDAQNLRAHPLPEGAQIIQRNHT
jgi:hypothetical protein